MTKKICYVWDEELIKQTDRLPAVPTRASLVHDLIEAYDLLNKLIVVRSVAASFDDLNVFHSDQYLNHLKTIEEVDDDYIITPQDEEYGLGYDCQPVCRIYDLVSAIAGGSVTAAKCLTQGAGEVAINWCGGWHHANKHGADGFCFVNDCVLAIENLKTKFNRILYIDLDVHHGNGVEDAFCESQSVFTLSIHKYEPGFYPGTGSVDDIAKLNGKGYKANIPLKGFYGNEIFCYAFQKVFRQVISYFKPDAIVVQCGADALARDPHGGASLTEEAYVNTIKLILDENKPSLLLGGGGYNITNAARLWTTITAYVVGVTLDDMIPEHSYWPQYGTDYMLHIEKPLARDPNTKLFVDQLLKTILGKLIDTSEELHVVRKKTIMERLKDYENKETPDSAVDVYEFVD